MKSTLKAILTTTILLASQNLLADTNCQKNLDETNAYKVANLINTYKNLDCSHSFPSLNNNAAVVVTDQDGTAVMVGEVALLLEECAVEVDGQLTNLGLAANCAK